MTVGSSVREILFNISISEKRPDRVIIVDAVDMGRPPGELFRLDVGDIPLKKIDDFSMHQIPTSNMLRELQDLAGVTVDIWVAQVQRIPEQVSPGLTPTLRAAVPEVCKKIYASISETLR